MIDIKPGDIVQCIKRCPTHLYEEPWAFPPDVASIWTVEFACRGVDGETGQPMSGGALRLVGDTLPYPGARPLPHFRKLCDAPESLERDETARIDDPVRA